MKNLLTVFFLVIFAFVIVSSVEINKNKHTLVKRQSEPVPPRANDRPFPLSRSRQFPAPEEVDETPEEVNADIQSDPPQYEVEPPPARRPVSRFRGRQQVGPAEVEDAVNATPAPETTPAPEKSTAAPSRSSRFGVNRPRLQISPQSQTDKPATDSPTSKPAASASSSSDSASRSRSRLSPRADVDAENPSSDTPIRRSGTGRVRARGSVRSRTSSTTTTTTTTTTKAPLQDDEYYYYYEDEEEGGKKQPLATTSTTTTTTTRAPSLPRRPATSRRPSVSRPATVATSRSTVKFDPESQFQPPPEDATVEEEVVIPTERSTRKFTTRTTAAPGPGGIPAHLTHMYKVRPDGRFIDYYRDPNRPRELKGFDLTDYPFYIRVPEDIDFDCNSKQDGYFASVPHHCQLFHYCFAGARYDFLCANYTLYDQTTFTCRYANNVDCEKSADFYYRNDDLWKETTTTSTTKAPEVKRKRKKDYDDDYEDEEEYEYDEADEDEDEERRGRPNRRRNRQRKNRRKISES